MPAGNPPMDVLPPEDGLPPWQPAQVFAVGLDELKDAWLGVADIVGTCNCAPRITSAIRIPADSASTGRRNLLNLIPSGKNFFTSSAPRSVASIAYRKRLDISPKHKPWRPHKVLLH